MSAPGVSDQISAGISLIDWSHLAFWKGGRFEANTRYVFEDHHPRVHERFGRLICWLQFSVGAEYLAKGFCLIHGIASRSGQIEKEGADDTGARNS